MLKCSICVMSPLVSPCCCGLGIRDSIVSCVTRTEEMLDIECECIFEDGLREHDWVKRHSGLLHIYFMKMWIPLSFAPFLSSISSSGTSTWQWKSLFLPFYCSLCSEYHHSADKLLSTALSPSPLPVLPLTSQYVVDQAWKSPCYR